MTGDPFPLVDGPAPPDAHLVVPAGGSLAGSVIGPDGAPSAWCAIEWRGRERGGSTGTAACDATGAFLLEGLPRGMLVLRLRSTSGLRQNMRVTPPLRPDERRQGFVAQLVRRVEVSGFVVDTEGRPVDGVTLAFDSQVDPEWSAFADTQADGSFVLSDVPPGAVEIEPLSGDPGEDDPEWIPWDQRGQVVDAPAQGVRIVVPPPRKVGVSARIVGPDGAPIPLCFVVATRKREESDPIRTPAPGARGRRRLASARALRLPSLRAVGGRRTGRRWSASRTSLRSGSRSPGTRRSRSASSPGARSKGASSGPTGRGSPG